MNVLSVNMDLLFVGKYTVLFQKKETESEKLPRDEGEPR